MLHNKHTMQKQGCDLTDHLQLKVVGTRVLLLTLISQ